MNTQPFPIKINPGVRDVHGTAYDHVGDHHELVVIVMTDQNLYAGVERP